MPALQISSLIPKRDTIDFGDGLILEIKSWSELHALDMGHLANLQGKAQVLIDAAREEGIDPAEQADRIAQLHAHLDTHLLYITPDLRPEMLAPLGLSVKQGVINWWRVQHLKELGKESDGDDPNTEGQE